MIGSGFRMMGVVNIEEGVWYIWRPFLVSLLDLHNSSDRTKAESKYCCSIKKPRSVVSYTNSWREKSFQPPPSNSAKILVSSAEVVISTPTQSSNLATNYRFLYAVQFCEGDITTKTDSWDLRNHTVCGLHKDILHQYTCMYLSMRSRPFMNLFRVSRHDWH